MPLSEKNLLIVQRQLLLIVASRGWNGVGSLDQPKAGSGDYESKAGSRRGRGGCDQGVPIAFDGQCAVVHCPLAQPWSDQNVGDAELLTDERELLACPAVRPAIARDHDPPALSGDLRYPFRVGRARRELAEQMRNLSAGPVKSQRICQELLYGGPSQAFIKQKPNGLFHAAQVSGNRRIQWQARFDPCRPRISQRLARAFPPTDRHRRECVPYTPTT